MVLEFEIKGQDKSKSISKEQFALLVQKSNAEPVPGYSDFRTMYSAEAAWLLMNYTAEPEPQIRLSLSLANPKLELLLSDSIRTVASVAAHFDAIACECESRQEINQANADELSDPAAPFMLQLIRRWEACLNETNAADGAPLELPLAGRDYISEYFCFNLFLSQAMDFSVLDQQLGFSTRLKQDSPTDAAIFDKNTLRPLSKVKLIQNGKGIRLQPFYWKESFSIAAAETLQIAELLAATLGAQLHFFDTPVDAALLLAIKEPMKGLGLEFSAWSQKYK